MVIAASSAQLPALCAQAGGRKCIVRAATAEELLLAVLAALEVNTPPLARDSLAGLCLHTECAAFQSQGVHIPPESMPVQLLHRDAEFRESVSDPTASLGDERARAVQIGCCWAGAGAGPRPAPR